MTNQNSMTCFAIKRTTTTTVLHMPNTSSANQWEIGKEEPKQGLVSAQHVKSTLAHLYYSPT